MDVEILLVIVVSLALIFDFVNGFHDSANVVATIIASRAMTPRAALLIAAVASFIGPFVFGVAVATTIGKNVIIPEVVTSPIVLAAVIGAIIWNLITWWLGIPSSSSHALIGGLIGAVWIGAGLGAIRLEGIGLVAIALLTSPVVGFVAAVFLIRLILWLTRDATPKANLFFKYAQVPTAIVLALGIGSNNAQKTMGIITLGLVVLGYQSDFAVPFWVVLVSAIAIGLGTAMGGWRIIRTLGGKFYRIRPVHSFASQLASAVVVLGVSLAGGPVSSTHVVSSAILGAGAGQRKSQVRWGVLRDIFAAWLLTLPAAAGLSALSYLVIVNILGA